MWNELKVLRSINKIRNGQEKDWLEGIKRLQVHTNQSFLVCLTGDTSAKKKNQPTLNKWTPPERGYKLNSDGSSIGNPDRSGIGGVIRDHNGDWIVGYMGNLHMSNNVKAELTALMQGLRIALARGLLPLEVNIDCKKFITFIENDHPSYTNMIFDCRDLLGRLGNPPIQHTFREANRVADALARDGSKINQANLFFCLKVPPVCVLEKLDADKGGTIFVRLQRPIPTSINCISSSYNVVVSSQNCTSRHLALPLPQGRLYV
ncbi:hypothetical protein KY289_032596 [Solanum tuberosum]|nr:hypothetical protein KY289_032596 [Solanum tuberosum]